MEEGINILYKNAGRALCRNYEQCQDRVRKSPTTAVLGAIAAGYLLNRLPLRAILVTKIRVLLALTPPALILFGAAKLYGFLQKQAPEKP
jgi:hypothetical protein